MTELKQALAPRHVFALLLSLALVTWPHSLHLPLWVMALVSALAAWRAYLAYYGMALPGRWLMLLVGVGATLGVYLSFRTIFGREAGMALLVVMLGVKLLETRELRDAMLLVFLGYFLVVTNFLYLQTIPIALYMLACTWVITATLVSLHYVRDEPPIRDQFRIAGMQLALSAPLMVALFVLFPRVPGPLWGMPHDAYSGVSGLSDTMTPGSISNLILSGAVAFRVSFETTMPRSRQLYWRGPVMWDFDGRTWTAPRFFYSSRQLEITGEPVTYEVTLEPHNRRWMFALDLPGNVPPRAYLSTDFQIFAHRPLNNRLRYDMVSYLNPRYGISENLAALQRARRLPPDANPRTLELARALRAKHTSDRAIVDEVLEMFRSQRFFYTLEPPLLGENPVDEFLFSTRSGFCEHFASAFAVLMRGAGIPARIVTGYQGGEINNLGDYLIVRQSDAHAWTEVWLADQGWVRIDPTAAVSPLRVDSGISAAVPRSSSLPLLVRGDVELLRQLRLTWDVMANAWNQWVLGYTPERQRRLLEDVGIADATWQKLAIVLICVTALIVLMLAGIMLRQIKVRVRDPVKIAYLRFCAKLRRKGMSRDPTEGPVDYAHRLERLRPDLAPAVAAITGHYVALRYGAADSTDGLDELRRQVRQFSA